MLTTAWFKWSSKDKRYEFNHIENGWALKNNPSPISNLQKKWLNEKWLRKYCFMFSHKVYLFPNLKMEGVYFYGFYLWCLGWWPKRSRCKLDSIYWFFCEWVSIL